MTPALAEAIRKQQVERFAPKASAFALQQAAGYLQPKEAMRLATKEQAELVAGELKRLGRVGEIREEERQWKVVRNR